MDSIDILKFAENLNKDIENKKKGLPYNINVIDELHINENAHSRILCKLLQYKNDEGKYEMNPMNKLGKTINMNTRIDILIYRLRTIFCHG